jgi:parallel beta helix pectate lyase-like protein
VGTSDEIQRIIDAHPAGTTYCLAAGRHRILAPLVPRRGDDLVGERGAVLSGSIELNGWQRTGAGWSARGRLPAEPSENGECAETAPSCQLAEDVFVDGRRLERVAAADDVAPGTVYGDYRSGMITIGDDPTGRLVEQATAPSLINSIADDVTVENLVLEQAANEAQFGAIETRQVEPEAAGSGWTIRNNEIRLNHGVGIGFGGRSLVAGNSIHHQGQLGFGAWGDGSVVRDNDIFTNGVAGYSGDWEAGGSKSWLTEDLSIVHNRVHDNRGPGLWTDGGNLRTTYEYNVVTDNDGAGIQHEISYDATIRYNEVADNGRVHKGWAWEAGIQIQSSGGTCGQIDVAHNTVTGGANGIVLIESGDRANEDPAPHGPHLVRNVHVHDNTVTLSPGGTSGAVEDIDDQTVFDAGGNRFESNTYRLPTPDGSYFSWDGADLSWQQWRGSGTGNDLDGRIEAGAGDR